ncbi:cytochrome ubiquinol oxidase subunit I [Muricoccus pecuniae]|uniref:Cytochrome d ubiquinol oxidase subunit I n=1 Tax=Muricoccus pecuniae TaxID=693023 RepID=A0A840Y4W3_9PROT|nr:cytochrome ubiquinol oxidase subunit I [Roseomonas pecuniae]MBB5695196.1 cytochrome d ubiquinol oxidase subunit I [Roseomonas pecuniae]
MIEALLPSALDLARFQFAFVVVWHFLFPAFTIGLASYLAVLEGLWLWTGKAVYIDTFRYWLKVFAVAFAMGVVSGLVMSYQFGTNWSVLSDKAGPVIGPLMGYEVLTAFFLEAGFLGVMLFGLDRVGKGLHMLATSLVAAGTFFSAFWILSVNSWMHTPQGHVVTPDGRFLPDDWWAIIFNPSFPYRLAHTVTGAYLTTALIVGAVGAWHLLRERRGAPAVRDAGMDTGTGGAAAAQPFAPGSLVDGGATPDHPAPGSAGADRGEEASERGPNPRAKLMFSMAMWMLLFVAPLQAVLGDLHGTNTYEHQPAKVAAMEGHFETERGAPSIIFGIPDPEQERTRMALEIPNLASLYLTHDWNGEVRGLKDIPREYWPTNIPLVFFAFRVMVGLGLLMIGLGLAGGIMRLRGRLYSAPWLLRAAVAMGPAGLVAVTAGWIVTEAGRQPFTVYGVLRTADSVSPIALPAVATSLAAFVVVYFLVFGAGIWFLFKLFSQTPRPHEGAPPQGQPIRSAGITPAPSISAGAARPGPGTSGAAPQPAE